MVRILTCLTLIICLGFSVFAQQTPPPEKPQDKPLDQRVTDLEELAKKIQALAKEKGISLGVNLSVGDNVKAEAVLIPQKDARKIFSREIAENYAVIQLVVGNKSDDASLIIHGVFIDYSRWALSGSNDASDFNDRLIQKENKPFQTSTDPHHIASEEYRVVRSQLLDAQRYTWRNLTFRTLTFLGTVAGAFTFTFTDKAVKGPKIIAALTSNVPSGFATLFPDPTIDQLRMVDDFGYHTNKLVPQHGAEIIICFFPIDRFLTPGFRRLYLKSPSLFFSPLLMLADTKIQSEVQTLLGPEHDILKLRPMLPCYMRIAGQIEAQEKAVREKRPDAIQPPSDPRKASLAESMRKAGDDMCLESLGFRRNQSNGVIEAPDDNDSQKKRKNFLTLDYLSQLSLNRVQIVVDGVMTVDTSRITAKIDGIDFDPINNCDEHQPCFWTNLTTGGGVRTGRIRGSYLTGGEVKIKEAEDRGITEVKAVSAGSSDQVLHFSFKLTKAIADQDKLHFTISKSATDSSMTDSAPMEYNVKYTFTGPTITKDPVFDPSAKTLTVTGNGFIDEAPDNSLTITLHSPDGKDTKLDAKKLKTFESGNLVIPMDEQTAGCWTVKVTVGTKDSKDSEAKSFAILPAPTIKPATLVNGDIVIEGTDLIDTSTCGGKALSFKFFPNDTGDGIQLTGATTKSARKWVFPKDSNTQTRIGKTKGTIKVLVGTDVKDSNTGPAPVKPAKK